MSRINPEIERVLPTVVVHNPT